MYFGSRSRDYGSVLDVGNTTEVDVIDLDPGTYYFVVTAYDTSGNESQFSNEVSERVQAQ